MNKTDKIIYLHMMGLKPSHISRRLAISEQWISVILSRCPATWEWTLTITDIPDMDPEPEEKGRRIQSLAAKRRAQCVSILEKGATWTWVEANETLKEAGLVPPVQEITKLLKQSGFQYDRPKGRWAKV